MNIPSHDFDRVRNVCRHEAGHYVTARSLNFETDGISAAFFRSTGHSAEAGIFPFTPNLINIDGAIIYLERRIQVLYAGVIAEAMGEDRIYNENYALNQWREGGGIIDYAKIRELTHTLRNIQYPTTVKEEAQLDYNKIDDNLFKKAFKIVDNNIQIIYQIGNLLAKKIEGYNMKYTLSENEIASFF